MKNNRLYFGLLSLLVIATMVVFYSVRSGLLTGQQSALQTSVLDAENTTDVAWSNEGRKVITPYDFSSLARSSNTVLDERGTVVNIR